MKRLIGFCLIALALAWLATSDVLQAIEAFLFFAAGLCAWRFVASLVLNQRHTWTAWRERITQVVVLEGAGFAFLYIQDRFLSQPSWWGSGDRLLFVVIEALPSLIFLLLSWGVIKVSLASRKTAPATARRLCSECGSVMEVVSVVTTGLACPGCRGTSGIK